MKRQVRIQPPYASLAAEYRATQIHERWFDRLAPAVRDDVLSCAQAIELAPGQQLTERGAPASGLFQVAEGLVRVGGINREGRHTVLDFYGPGFWFGEVAALAGLPGAHDMHALRPTLLRRLAPRDLEKLLRRQPDFARALLRLEAQRLNLLLAALESYATQTLAQRLANRLLMLAAAHAVPTAEGDEIDIALSQETLARLIGSSRQRVAQMLKAWERDGAVRHRNERVLLLRPQLLEDLARL
jgi:CRP/FNR family transcriptional regulator, cyclic AMP receptor protein